MGSRHYRAHQRYPVVAHIVVRSATRGIEARGQLVDLGLGGAACDLDTPLRLGEVVVAQIDGGEDPLPAVEAEVAWVTWAEASAVRLGLRFVGENPATVLAALDRLVMPSDVGT